MATYQFVPEHNGIEIYFDVKPSEDVLEGLRSNGWRWHRVKQCWFSKRNSETEKFAKTLCNESPDSKFQEKKESHPIEIEETASFNYIISDQSIFSSVTITRKHQRYTVSSTNNQITCCDCNRWISIHAIACPNCGCPQNYIIEYYFNKYNTQAVAEQQEQERRRLREQRRAEEHKREEIINNIRSLFHYNLWNKVYKLPLSDLQIAYDRANYLYSHRDELSYISSDDLSILITADELSYQEQLEVLRQKKKKKDEEVKKQKETEEFRKRDKLRYYQLNYPQYGLSPEKHMHLSEHQINDIIKKLSNK